jgi:hypothetical protein
MGDWTYGELAKAGPKENQDFGWVSPPETEGAFLMVADGFGIWTAGFVDFQARTKGFKFCCSALSLGVLCPKIFSV